MVWLGGEKGSEKDVGARGMDYALILYFDTLMLVVISS